MFDSQILMYFLIIILSNIMSKPVVQKVGYGGVAGTSFVVISIINAAIFRDLSTYIEPRALNYYLLMCTCASILYELFIISNTSEVDLEAGQKEQDRISFDGGKFISPIKIENRRNARKAINRKVFGILAWDTFTD